MTRVLPEPAPARTRSGPFVVQDGLCLVRVEAGQGGRVGHCEIIDPELMLKTEDFGYSTVTDFARFLGWSTSQPRRTAMW